MILKRDTEIKRLAFEWRYWNWMDYKFGDRCVILRSNIVKKRKMVWIIGGNMIDKIII